MDLIELKIHIVPQPRLNFHGCISHLFFKQTYIFVFEPLLIENGSLLVNLHYFFFPSVLQVAADIPDDWNPMADDFLSVRNAYKVDTDDPGVATVNYRMMFSFL